MIYVISLKDASIKRSLGIENKAAWIGFLSQIPREFDTESQYYLDTRCFSEDALKRTIKLFGKNNVHWGIIDPKGECADPASYFFEGALDYIGPALIKKGLTKKRLTAPNASERKNKTPPAKPSPESKSAEAGKKKNHKLPAGKFGGWSSVRPGTTSAFFFLFVSLSAKNNLRSMIGENAFSALRLRLRELLQHRLKEAESLLWMDTESNCLFLIPPRAACCKAAIKAVLKIILNSRLIGIEKLGLSIPVEFTFALHYGQTTYQTPGKTGSIISESVNYIFHLGTKKADTGRLTISDEVPEETIPYGLKHFFTDIGTFEGIPLRHSRRFIYE